MVFIIFDSSYFQYLPITPAIIDVILVSPTTLYSVTIKIVFNAHLACTGDSLSMAIVDLILWLVLMKTRFVLKVSQYLI
jgi:hypothetical protein